MTVKSQGPEARNMLERCTSGPCRVKDGHRIWAKDGLVAEAYEHPNVRGYDEAHANAQLLALAYDHALWGAAAGVKIAAWYPLAYPDNERGEVICGGMRYLTHLDAFKCPLLTPGLRAALRAALGLSRAD